MNPYLFQQQYERYINFYDQKAWKELLKVITEMHKSKIALNTKSRYRAGIYYLNKENEFSGNEKDDTLGESHYSEMYEALSSDQSKPEQFHDKVLLELKHSLQMSDHPLMKLIEDFKSILLK